jgi:gamma-glutamylaminecyclotransferase
MLLLVYGTLKRGYGNHRVIEGAKFIGPYTLRDKFYLRDLGPFPAAIRSRREGTIIGELYQIDEHILERTDVLEGYPHFYDRTEVDTDHGKAHLYFMEQDHERTTCPIVTEWNDNKKYA